MNFSDFPIQSNKVINFNVPIFLDIDINLSLEVLKFFSIINVFSSGNLLIFMLVLNDRINDYFCLKEGDAYGLRWNNGVGTLPGSSLKVVLFILHLNCFYLNVSYETCILVSSKRIRYAGSYPRCRRH